MIRLKTTPKHWVCLALVLAIAGCYWPVIGHQFLNCDDPDYITVNSVVRAGLTWAGLKWAVITFCAANWHPVTWLSHMLDVQLFGINPAAHHVVNVLFHATNSVLLLFVLHRLTGAFWRSALVAALFALHPLHVESVAWAAERKDVLSTFFFLLLLLTYAQYSRTERRGIWYAASLVLFALGLMSKPMLVTAPFVLLLLDWWPLARMKQSTLHRLLIEKLPFLALSVGAGILTLIAQRQGGAVLDTGTVPFWFRLENALVSYASYLQKAFWPTRLAAYYPLELLSGLTVFAAGAVLVGITIASFSMRTQRRQILAGWLWYLITLLPVIGLIQAGSQSMADRYTYIPLIGVFIIVAWLAGEVASAGGKRIAIVSVCFAALVGCFFATAYQVRFWANSETLFRHALAVTTGNAHAHLSLGGALAEQGKFADAAEQYAEAVRLAPPCPRGETGLGMMLTVLGHCDEAIPHFQAAVQAEPTAIRHQMLGAALSSQGRHAEAMAQFRIALKLNPDLVESLNDLAWDLATDPQPEIRDGAEAVTLAERACRLAGVGSAQLQGTLAAAYAEAGRFDEAISTAKKACELASSSGDKKLLERNQELLSLYLQHQPYHEAPSR